MSVSGVDGKLGHRKSRDYAI